MEHQLAKCLACRKPIRFFWEKLKFSAMSDDNHTFTILWHAVIHCIDQTNLNDIVQRLQCFKYLLKIPAVTVENASDIFKGPNLRLNLLHGRNENRKPIP